MGIKPVQSGTSVASGSLDPNRIVPNISARDVEKTPKNETDEKLNHIAGEVITSEEFSIREAACRRYAFWTAQTIPPDLWEYILTHMEDRTFDEWLEILRERTERFSEDENVPKSFKDYLRSLCDGQPLDGMSIEDYETVVEFEAYIIYDWSIYPQVRSCTKPYGWEESEDYENFRTYVISLFFALAACALDTFFYERKPPVSLQGGAIQILMAGVGKLWALMPRIAIPMGRGREFIINSGKPWNYREQMFGTVVFAVSIGCNWAEDVAIVLSNPHFFNLGFLEDGITPDPQGPASFGFVILTQLSFALTGFGLAGIMRTFFVYPEECVYYDTLYFNFLGRSMTENEPREKPVSLKLKTYEMFWIFGWCNFAWYWITNLGFEALSQFGWMTWISPDNIDLNAITGISTGLAINPIATFDTNVIGTGSQSCTFFYTPWTWLWQWHFGALIATIGIIVMWYTNVRYTKYLPINAPDIFDNTGNGTTFDVTKVLDENNAFDDSSYQQYSQPYFSAGYLLTYGVSFMYMPAVVVWMILYKWKLMVKNVGSFAKGIFSTTKILENYDDRFSREMKKHKEAPEYWYFAMLCVGFGFSIATVEHYGFVQCPVWTLFVGAAIAWVLLLPANTLRATTTYFFNPSKFLSIIFGLALPHNGTGNLFAMYYAYCFTEQTDNWVDNQKIAHYSGIKPRSMFRGQLISTLLSAFVMSGIVTWQAQTGMGDFQHFCTTESHSKFVCINAKTYFNDAVAFGTIGPRITFNQIYPTLKWTFLIGALFPIPFWVCKVVLPILSKRFPENSRSRNILSCSWLQYINEIVILNAGMYWGTYNWMYYFPNFYLGALWHFVAEKKYPRFWSKYSYILYNAVSVGVSFAALFCFFAAQYNHKVSKGTRTWWGNTVFGTTLDANEQAVYPLDDPRGYFGPDKGSFRTD